MFKLEVQLLDFKLHAFVFCNCRPNFFMFQNVLKPYWCLFYFCVSLTTMHVLHYFRVLWDSKLFKRYNKGPFKFQMDKIAIDSSLFPFTPALDMLEFISRPLSFSPISSIRILQTKLTFDVKYFEIWIYFHKWQWGSSLLFIVKYSGEHNWRAIILKKITPPETCFENHPKKNPKESTRISHQRTFIKK